MDLNTTILLISVLAPVGVGVGKVLVTFLESKLPQDKQYEIEGVIGNVVRAVEQSMPGNSPEEKKAKAIELANALLKASKLPVNPVVVDTLIEEAVFRLPDTNKQSAIPFGA